MLHRSMSYVLEISNTLDLFTTKYSVGQLPKMVCSSTTNAPGPSPWACSNEANARLILLDQMVSCSLNRMLSTVLSLAITTRNGSIRMSVATLFSGGWAESASSVILTARLLASYRWTCSWPSIVHT
uniref:(northern house mosquito) hypothetical protein n=1 Tax=Culex pipiens TaxID=7175 RepID=A0A8D8ACZ5_CULPI